MLPFPQGCSLLFQALLRVLHSCTLKLCGAGWSWQGGTAPRAQLLRSVPRDGKERRQPTYLRGYTDTCFCEKFHSQLSSITRLQAWPPVIPASSLQILFTVQTPPCWLCWMCTSVQSATVLVRSCPWLCQRTRGLGVILGDSCFSKSIFKEGLVFTFF